MALRKVKTGGNRALANIVPNTFNREERTVEVTWATERPVLTGYYDRFYEILSFDTAHVRMERLNSGAPLLDSHDKWGGAADQPGVVIRAWVDNGMGHAIVKFANDKSTISGVKDGPGERLMNRVEEGTVRNLSVGYNVFEYEEIDAAGSQSQGKAKENSIPTYRAIDWEPFEISFVSIPADIGAGVRSGAERSSENIPSYEVEVRTINNNNQNEDMKFGNRMQRDNGAGSGAGGGSAAPATQNQGGNAPATPNTAAPEGGEGNRSANPAQQPAPAPAPAAPAAQEGNRSGDLAMSIMERCEAAGLGLSFARTLIGTPNITAERAFSMIIDEYAKDNTPTQTSHNRSAVTGDSTVENRRAGMQNALEHRLGTRDAEGKPIALTDLGREYRGMSLLDMGRDIIEGMGGSTRGLYKADVAKLALNIADDGVRSRAFRAGGNGMMSTSDFPLILGNTVNRTLRAEYDVQERTFLPFSRRTTATDFRPMGSVQLGEIASFQKVKEGGEYRRTSMGEASESYKVEKYGEIIPITWEALVNDDLGAFSRILPKIAAAAARTQSDLVYGMLLQNPTMGDSVSLFHTSHGNVIASGTAISINAMGAMRLLMRKQMGLNGKDFLNITPKYLVTGPANEQLALQFTSDMFTPTQMADQNVWRRLVTPIIEPRITDNSWYLVAAPGQIDTLEYAFLEGDGELFTEQRTGFDVDGLEIKARMVFGCKVIDWRGFALNPGA